MSPTVSSYIYRDIRYILSLSLYYWPILKKTGGSRYTIGHHLHRAFIEDTQQLVSTNRGY